MYGGCDARAANVSHLALATVSGRPYHHYHHVPAGQFKGGPNAKPATQHSLRALLEGSVVVLADCSALEALSPPLPALLEAWQSDRDVLQALLNYQLSERTPADALALRSAAERAALDTGRLEWDGDCHVASGLCHAPSAPPAVAAETAAEL